jgi:hypothetical protein
MEIKQTMTKAAIRGAIIGVAFIAFVLGIGSRGHDYIDAVFLGTGLILSAIGLWAIRFMTPRWRAMRFELLPGVFLLLLAFSGFKPSSFMSFGSALWWVVFCLALLSMLVMSVAQWREASAR